VFVVLRYVIFLTPHILFHLYICADLTRVWNVT